MNESCHAYEWVMSHIRMSHVSHICAGVCESAFHVFMNESCHTHEYVMSHIWMSHVTHVCVGFCASAVHVLPSVLHGQGVLPRHQLEPPLLVCHCNTLQHTATRCNTLQHTAIHCSTLQQVKPSLLVFHCNTLRRTATLLGSTFLLCHCNTLQHTAAPYNTMQQCTAHCNNLQHTATHCTTLQHTATHSNTMQHTLNQWIERCTLLIVCVCVRMSYVTNNREPIYRVRKTHIMPICIPYSPQKSLYD